jgi:hypothetical protein
VSGTPWTKLSLHVDRTRRTSGNGNSGDKGMDTDGRSDAPPRSNLGAAGSTNHAQTGSSHKTRMTGNLGKPNEIEGSTTDPIVYQLLMQKRNDKQRGLLCVRQVNSRS